MRSLVLEKPQPQKKPSDSLVLIYWSPQNSTNSGLSRRSVLALFTAVFASDRLANHLISIRVALCASPSSQLYRFPHYKSLFPAFQIQPWKFTLVSILLFFGSNLLNASIIVSPKLYSAVPLQRDGRMLSGHSFHGGKPCMLKSTSCHTQPIVAACIMP